MILEGVQRIQRLNSVTNSFRQTALKTWKIEVVDGGERRQMKQLYGPNSADLADMA